MTKRMIILLSVAALLLGTVAVADDDDRYPHGRWAIGIDGLRSIIGDTEEDEFVLVDEEAPGAAFQVGYMVSPSLQLRLYTGAAAHPTAFDGLNVTYGSGTIDLVYLFRQGAGFRPYIAGGLGGFTLESQVGSFKFETEGGGAALGIGFHWHLNRRLALHGQVRSEAINWKLARATNEAGEILETPVEWSGSAGKVALGLAVWF